MTNYERGLLIGLTTLFLTILIGALFASIVLDASVFIVWFSAINSVSWVYIIVFFIGLWRMYQEFIDARKFQKLKSLFKGKPIKSSSQKIIILSGVIYAAFWIVLVLLVYVSGDKDGFLDLIFVLMVGGTGFLIIFAMMFIGTIFGRLIK